MNSCGRRPHLPKRVYLCGWGTAHPDPVAAGGPTSSGRDRAPPASPAARGRRLLGVNCPATGAHLEKSSVLRAAEADSRHVLQYVRVASSWRSARGNRRRPCPALHVVAGDAPRQPRHRFTVSAPGHPAPHDHRPGHLRTGRRDPWLSRLQHPEAHRKGPPARAPRGRACAWPPRARRRPPAG